MIDRPSTNAPLEARSAHRETAAPCSERRVVVIGGGLAGMAAACALATAGVKVMLLESKPRLGGRAASFPDAASGELVDNCQHVSMGCCTNLSDFCRRVGIDHLLSREPTLYFQDEQGTVSRMRAWPLPAPLHLIPAFACARYLTIGDKIRIAYGMGRLTRRTSAPEGVSFRDWLLAHRQTTRTCDRFWGLVLTSALNETLENVDFRYARQTFVEGFLRHRASGVVEIPKAPLSEFYGRTLEDWLVRHGVDLRLGTAATGLEIADDSVTGCRTRDGALPHADHYLLATTFGRVADLLPEKSLADHPEFARLAKIGTSPITSVHLWYDRPVMDLPHLVPVGRTIQWLFRRTASNPHDGRPASGADDQPIERLAEGGQYVQAVISAARELSAMGNEEVFRRIAAEIEAILPAARAARIVRHRVVTERSATFSVRPGIDRWRPSQTTGVANLWLAGDYTRTGWPATMEGAVRSGYLAAERILDRCGIPTHFVRPPLKAGPLFRLLVREPRDA